ncbi:unannotated protein [freshwater metagenome]|uniref:Unannotated protein n=1 Tax=freshwater metagenome TaxID=449393 RepID=A0A6J7EBZ1_9ZZZZ
MGQAVVDGPITTGNGAVVLSAGAPDLAAVGYVQEEYFISGTASAFRSATSLSADGRWSATPVNPAPYTTRIVVRRPVDAARSNGTVAVEWLNVTAGFDTAPDWTGAHVEMIRSGWTWVGVSAQAVGIVGSKRSLVAALALKNADPVRYGPLSHPGDNYSYDIFSQAGALVRTKWQQVLGGIEPKHILALGESQSAFRLTTYVNAVAPIADVYDGFMLHSRGAIGAPLFSTPFQQLRAPDPTLLRTDHAVPVLVFETETDMVAKGLDYRRVDQPDDAFIRGWQVPGTAHQDLYGLGIGDGDLGDGAADVALFASMSDPPNAIYGGVITCEVPINTGPHPYVLRAALAALNTWVATGSAPTSMPAIELNASGDLVLDDAGNARGGIRTPHLDAPIAQLSGIGQPMGKSFCGLFGTTTPLDATTLAAKYPTHEAFVRAWETALDHAVASGAVLPADAVQLRTAAQTSVIGAP